ncbi:NAD-dependent epimerase/dehydratase family protein [Amycolatopsis pigmentata]|uniref:NAD-dependent epimerase/dehydratase family protein n=1 Tax=Amycolatopsis pigmentata TaxID=450801 RepID=A0ABW5FZ69_9PSEU
MTILITGGTGRIGPRLLPRILDSGDDCRALVRSGKTVPTGVTAVEGDLLDPESLPQAVKGVSAVVHLAAVLRAENDEDVHRVNVDGTRNLVNAVREHAPDARFIMAGTTRVYDADLPRPAREDDPVGAQDAYPASKIIAERVLRESGLTWSVLRFALVYGDGDGHLQAAPRVLASWKWHPAQAMSLLHHRDIATGVRLALTGALDGHIVNLVDDAPASAYEISRLVGADFPESAEPLTNPWSGRADGSLARQLGFVPVVRSMYQAAAEGAL